MPNWCENTLTITGNKDSIAKIKTMAIESFKAEIKKEKIEEKIKNFLSAEHYRNELQEFLRVKKLSVKDILSKELGLIENENGDWEKNKALFLLTL